MNSWYKCLDNYQSIESIYRVPPCLRELVLDTVQWIVQDQELRIVLIVRKEPDSPSAKWRGSDCDEMLVSIKFYGVEELHIEAHGDSSAGERPIQKFDYMHSDDMSISVTIVDRMKMVFKSQYATLQKICPRFC